MEPICFKKIQHILLNIKIYIFKARLLANSRLVDIQRTSFLVFSVTHEIHSWISALLTLPGTFLRDCKKPWVGTFEASHSLNHVPCLVPLITFYGWIKLTWTSKVLDSRVKWWWVSHMNSLTEIRKVASLMGPSTLRHGLHNSFQTSLLLHSCSFSALLFFLAPVVQFFFLGTLIVSYSFSLVPRSLMSRLFLKILSLFLTLNFG